MEQNRIKEQKNNFIKQQNRYPKTYPLKFIKKPHLNTELHQISHSKYTQYQSEIHSQLNSKYQIYKSGTPNHFEQQYQILKAKNIFNEIKTIENPAVIFKIADMMQCSYNKNEPINKRNVMKYPYNIKKSCNSSVFKVLTSQKQEMNDFCLWFKRKMTQIQQNQTNTQLLFQKRQNVIACAFNQTIQQVSRLSKDRAKILKMIWNTLIQQIQTFMQKICTQTKQQQQQNIKLLKQSHSAYQNQIKLLNQQKIQLKEQLQDLKLINNKLVFNFRTERKIRIKNQILVKQLKDLFQSTRQQYIHLLQQNTKLLVNLKDISKDQAKTILYRKIQASQQNKIYKVKPLKKIKETIKNTTQNQLLKFNQQNGRRQKQLFDYILERFREHPQQQQYIREDYFEDEVRIEDYLKSIIQSEQVSKQLKLEHNLLIEKQSIDCQINTDTIKINKNKSEDAQIQVNIQQLLQKKNQNSKQKRHQKSLMCEQKIQLKSIIHEGDGQIFYHKKRIQQKQVVLRNSLFLLQMEKTIDFAKSRSKYQQEEKNLNPIKQENKQVQQCQALEIKDSDSQSDEQVNNVSQISKKSKYKRKQKFLKRKSYAPSSFKMEYENKGEECVQISSGMKQRQIKEMIKKYIKSNNGVQYNTNQRPDQNVYKIISKLYKGALKFSRQLNSFYLILQDTMKNSYGNMKKNSILSQKMLKFISQVNKFQKYNDIFKVTSLFLGVNQKYEQYNHIISQTELILYFKLYQNLSIKNPKQTSFNIINSFSSIRKLNIQLTPILSQYFSRNKIQYIIQKIYQIIGYQKQKKQLINQDSFIFKLDGICLFILQIYIITKKTYYQSYYNILQFLFPKQNPISPHTYLFLIQCFTLNNHQLSSQLPQNISIQKFYQFCILKQMKLYQQLDLDLKNSLNSLNSQIQNKYLKQINYQIWTKNKSQFKKIQITPFSSHIYDIISKYLLNPELKYKDNFQFIYNIFVYNLFKKHPL